MEGRIGSPDKGPVRWPKIYTVNLSPSIPERDQWLFTRVTVHWGKGTNQTPKGLLDTGSELMQNVTEVHQAELGLVEVR